MFRVRLGVAISAVVAAALSGVGGTPAYASSVVALWHMDDAAGSTMVDSSGNGLNGTLLNVNLGQPGSGTGVGDLSYGFSAKPAIVSVPTSALLNPGTADLAFSMRLRMTPAQRPSAAVGDYDMLRKGLAGTRGGDYKMEVLHNGFLFCRFRGSAGAVTFRHGPNLADNVWHSVSCTRRANAILLTVDGHSWSKAGATGTISNTSSMLIGAQNEAGVDQYQGLMDEASVATGPGAH
jgi:Concanavalin A-like lectin/glucanases superfamily